MLAGAYFFCARSNTSTAFSTPTPEEMTFQLCGSLLETPQTGGVAELKLLLAVSPLSDKRYRSGLASTRNQCPDVDNWESACFLIKPKYHSLHIPGRSTPQQYDSNHRSKKNNRCSYQGTMARPTRRQDCGRNECRSEGKVFR